jgi:hypothetical protein
VCLSLHASCQRCACTTETSATSKAQTSIKVNNVVIQNGIAKYIAKYHLPATSEQERRGVKKEKSIRHSRRKEKENNHHWTGRRRLSLKLKHRVKAWKTEIIAELSGGWLKLNIISRTDKKAKKVMFDW